MILRWRLREIGKGIENDKIITTEGKNFISYIFFRDVFTLIFDRNVYFVFFFFIVDNTRMIRERYYKLCRIFLSLYYFITKIII